MKKRTIALLILCWSCSSALLAAEVDEQFDKGARLLKGRRFEEAAAAFQKVTDKDHTKDEAWFYTGQSWFGAGRCQDGLNAYEEAIHIQPAKGNYWVGKGTSLFCLGRTDDSLQAFQKAVELDKNLDHAWYGLARCYALKAEKETALKHLARAIELRPYYKDWAYRDRSFRNLSNDKDFQKLIEP